MYIDIARLKITVFLITDVKPKLWQKEYTLEVEAPTLNYKQLKLKA